MVTGVAFTKLSLMSAPAENARSLPVMTMQRIVSSPSRPARTFTSSSISCSLIAFRTSGRFSCTVAMGPSRVTITISAMATSGSAECAGSERAAQSAESASQRGHLVARGPSARVGQHPDSRAGDGLVLLAGGRAVDQVRDADLPAKELTALVWSEHAVGETGLVKGSPEPIPRAGEMKPDRARPEARV